MTAVTLKHAHTALLIAHIKGPHIDWASLMPIVVLGGGALIVLLFGLIGERALRENGVPVLTILVLGGAIAADIVRFNHPASIVSGALRIDDLALIVDIICASSAVVATLLSWRGPASRQAGEGEYHSLLLFSVMGMAILVSAQELVTLFIGIELLSIPLYILCASEHRREGSLESGLKYLIIGSVGSATLVYGLAMVYGATGSTTFSGIAAAIGGGTLTGGVLGDPLLFGGLALVLVGFAFKASVAPFHQWTPDVYEGAPTPITAFMATATKAAALAVFIRFFDVAAITAQNTWAPMLAALAAITIIVGNVGALGQSSLKRMLGYSGVAQAGYMLAGVVVGTQLGVKATVLYLLVYTMMNLAAFAAIAGLDRDAGSDELSGLAGLGSRRPALAWPLTIAMLALAGIPGTVGFIGKFQLIHALVDGDYTWLAIVLVIGSMISLGYYLRVIATMWMGSSPAESAAYPGQGIALTPIAGMSSTYPPIAGGSPEADAAGAAAGIEPAGEIVLVGLVFGAACIFFGVIPDPLFQLAAHAGAALSSLF
ncbi:MAG TPA: NADH-quinone oxidoreductase subunit N [Solirubrobacteraceae bacterium]|nr:NADH-quinone oxidoreductase subunit N [Solirubrobacteraceae bacterium]